MARLGTAKIKYPVTGVMAAFLAGILFWGGFNWSLDLTNTESFCVSCHAMKAFVYKEYQGSLHYANRSGVRATCPDCHVPREWVHKVVRKVGSVNELFHWMRGSINTPEKFEAKRLALARHVWTSMERTDSRECRNCHDRDSMAQQAQTVSAGVMHGLADGWGETCIECHKGVVHALPREFDIYATMDEVHERMERDGIDCKLCHESIAAPPKGEEW